MSYGTPSHGHMLISPGGGQAPSVPMQQPMNLFRFGEQTIWSTTQLAIGAIASSTQRLFTTPIGQNGQGFGALTIAETNLKEGGRVPSGVAYDVFGVATEVGIGASGSTPIDTAAQVQALLNIQHNGVLSWDFTQTVVDICPVILAGAGGGAFGSVATGNAVNCGHMNNGNGAIWMYRKHPVALPGNSTFSIVLRFGGNADAVANAVNIVRVTLLGYYKNVIEIG